MKLLRTIFRDLPFWLAGVALYQTAYVGRWAWFGAALVVTGLMLARRVYGCCEARKRRLAAVR